MNKKLYNITIDVWKEINNLLMGKIKYFKFKKYIFFFILFKINFIVILIKQILFKYKVNSNKR